MAEYGEWTRKGAILSDVTAKKEYGVHRDFIIQGIPAGKQIRIDRLCERDHPILNFSRNPGLRQSSHASKIARGNRCTAFRFRGQFGDQAYESVAVPPVPRSPRQLALAGMVQVKVNGLARPIPPFTTEARGGQRRFNG